MPHQPSFGSSKAALLAVLVSGLAAGTARAQEPQLLSPVDKVDQTMIAWEQNQTDLAGRTATRFVTVNTTVLRSLADGPLGGTATMDIDLFGVTRKITLR